ncbi:MAG: hypothetical protein ABL891_20080 [Burkholderiales bacterium]
MSRLGNFGKSTSRAFTSVRNLSARERQRLVKEFSQVRGLMPLLMKPRNKMQWTGEDKAQLAVHLKRLSTLSPYLVVLVMPGGLLVLPALAWWLDRRRLRDRAPA